MGTTQRTTYTKALESIHECLQELCEKSDTGPLVDADGLLAQRLDQIERRQEETLDLLRQQNGNVRRHSEQLAQQAQWIEDHDTQVHPALTKCVESVQTKTNAFAWIDTALALLAGALGGLRQG